MTLTKATYSMVSGAPVNVLDYGAIGDGITDDTNAINQAIADNLGKQIVIPAKTYFIGGTVSITAGTKVSMVGATLYRKSSSLNTDPVVELLDSYSELTGGKIQTDNNSPYGIIVLGVRGTNDNRNAWYWRFSSCDLQGNNVSGSFGFAVISSDPNYPTANYFGFIDSITIKGFDTGCFFGESANAHNVSNLSFWQCKTANVLLRGAYGNNFSDLWFHQSTANGCAGIKLLNKVLGTQTDCKNNIFTNFNVETGNVDDYAIYIDSNCAGNVFIGNSNVSGVDVINNWNNTYLTGGVETSLPGQISELTISSGAATAVTPAGFFGVGINGAWLVEVNISAATQQNLNRTDLVLLSLRNAAFGGSQATLVSSAINSTGTNGEPETVAYAVNFSAGNTTPQLTVNITPVGPATNYTVRCRALKS